jgi:hypothetical protein
VLPTKIVYSGFWRSLESQFISELRQSSDSNIRFLISDGFYPLNCEVESGFLWITGTATITEDNWRSYVRYYFRARVGVENTDLDDIDLLTLLPKQEDTGWLSVDRSNRSFEIILA